MFFAPLAMRELLSTLGPRTREALGALLPGAVTLVVHNPQRLYPLACGDHPERLGVRLIEGPLGGAGCVIFQTSANRSGEPAPSRFGDIDAEILGGADLAIDGGELGGEPSTVVDLTALDSDGSWSVLREGAVSPAGSQPVWGHAGQAVPDEYKLNVYGMVKQSRQPCVASSASSRVA